MDELSQLDELIESDILEALGEEKPQDKTEEEINIENFHEEVDDIILSDVLEETSDIQEDEISLENHDENIIDENDEPLIEDIQKSDVTSNKIETTISSNDIGTLLSQLLANKTIEITIKIKD